MLLCVETVERRGRRDGEGGFVGSSASVGVATDACESVILLVVMTCDSDNPEVGNSSSVTVFARDILLL